VKGGDVGVAETAGELRFLTEAEDLSVVVKEVAVQDLDDPDLVEVEMARPVDLARSMAG
jgi:hypothetical protein